MIRTQNSKHGKLIHVTALSVVCRLCGLVLFLPRLQLESLMLSVLRLGPVLVTLCLAIEFEPFALPTLDARSPLLLVLAGP